MNRLYNNLKFHHVSMKVQNYEECLKFYLGLGMGIYCEWSWEENVGEFIKGDRNCFLDVGNGPFLELHEVREENSRPGVIEHMCLHVEDVDEVYEQALRLGAISVKAPFENQLMCEPKPIPNHRTCVVAGPAGEQIEILCWNGYDPYVE